MATSIFFVGCSARQPVGWCERSGKSKCPPSPARSSSRTPRWQTPRTPSWPVCGERSFSAWFFCMKGHLACWVVRKVRQIQKESDPSPRSSGPRCRTHWSPSWPVSRFAKGPFACWSTRRSGWPVERCERSRWSGTCAVDISVCLHWSPGPEHFPTCSMLSTPRRMACWSVSKVHFVLLLAFCDDPPLRGGCKELAAFAGGRCGAGAKGQRKHEGAQGGARGG